MGSIRTPGTLEVIGPTLWPILQIGKLRSTEVPCMKPHGIGPGFLGQEPEFLAQIRVLG